VSGVLSGWLVSLVLSIMLSLRRRLWTDALVAIATSLVLALPVGVLATVCVVANLGGPVAVLALVIATRDFKILNRMLRNVWNAPYLLHAQAQGLTRRQILQVHIAAVLSREVGSLALLSFTLALSVLVPLEVVFDVPGVGQLAWSAAMNRDLPVLVAVTGIMAACVGLAGLFLDIGRATETPQCA
jgi:peptide/nickel transport system permease protein